MQQQDYPEANKTFEKVLLASLTEQRRSRRWGIFFKILLFGYLFALLGMYLSSDTSSKRVLQKDHVALINLEGTIAAGRNSDADTVLTGLHNAFESENAKAVILRINSPGGSPVQSAYIYDEIKRLRKLYPEKKIYTVITDIGASGGYFIAAAGDAIYANGASIVGSIGVLMPGMGAVEAIHKLGIENRTMTSGKNKAFMDPFSKRNPNQEIFAQKLLDNVHEQFIRAVKLGRGDKLQNDPEIFSGLFWTGEQALKLGLIDGLGNASYVAREVVKIEDLVDYTVSDTLLDKLSNRMGVAFSKELVASLGLKPYSLS